jgi:hypothetical protein
MQAGRQDLTNAIVQEEARRLKGPDLEGELVTGPDEENEREKDENNEADEGMTELKVNEIRKMNMKLEKTGKKDNKDEKGNSK